MAYKDIYKGLSKEEKEKMLKADIPEFCPGGREKLSKERLEQGERDLDKIIKKFQEQTKNDRNKST